MSIPATRLEIAVTGCGGNECLFDVAMDAGVAAVVALVVTESLRSLIESL